MIYYSVLNNIIDSPKTKNELINSIIKKASSIVKEYGLDYIMDHNMDHYFDVNNNEIICLGLDPIVNRNATDVLKPQYRDYIVYNYTKNKYSVLIGYSKNFEPCQIESLSDKELMKLDKQLCDCSENAKLDKVFLKSIKETLPVGTFFHFVSDVKDYNYGNWYNLYYVVGEPYIASAGLGLVKIPCVQINISYYSDEGLSIGVSKYSSDQITVVTKKYNDEKKFGILNIDEAAKLILKITDRTNKKYSKSHYTNKNNELQEKINSLISENKKLTDSVSSVKTKTDKLKIQLSISENEDEINTLKKDIEKNNADKEKVDTKIDKALISIKKKLSELNLSQYVVN